MKNAPSKTITHDAKPLLKWAGGKSQLLNDILPLVPNKFGKYIEPFFGGGALYFSLKPKNSVIGDLNDEIINLYRITKSYPKDLIQLLRAFKHSAEDFYKIRNQNRSELSPLQMAARTIYLNKTCFNGLYRVNKQGHFNVPFGKYINPKICEEETIYACSLALQNTTIICDDYKSTLLMYAKENDFIFLDPPYLPISEYSDFKRYTKEQFYEEDHINLGKEVRRLHEMGCHVILTNSNHPLVHDLYGDFNIKIVKTRRNINSDGLKRTGEDTIINIPPKRKMIIRSVPHPLSDQIKKYPSTRYMGSKNKLLNEIWQACSKFEFNSVLDLFSGSGIVSYMFKAQGKTVHSNDYMAMSAVYTKAMVENNSVTLSLPETRKLIIPNNKNDHFVTKNFNNLYYTDKDNALIDIVRTNIKQLQDPYKKSIAMTALIRSCIKKRPRGVFTYTGQRYDDGRIDLQMTLEEHFMNAVELVNNAVFDNKKNNLSKRGDAMLFMGKPDLVYMDPPYYSTRSDNEYVRRYHFVEGLACDWKNVEIQWNTTTRKFKNYPTPFSSKKGASDAFDQLFEKFKDSLIVVSYSSNSLPTLNEMIEILRKYKNVEVLQIDHRYSFGNQNHKICDNKNSVKEYLFIGY
jgi:DNA adenine methylase